MTQALYILFQKYGLTGLFTFSYFEALVHPFPVDPLLVFFLSYGFSPYSLFFIAVSANVLGAICGYFLGMYYGEPLFLKFFSQERYDQGAAVIKKYGIFALFLGAVTPVPFTPVVWIVGIFEMNFTRFLLLVIIGRSLRFGAVLFFGDVIIEYMKVLMG
ncbi:hypothetical protein COB57_03220 [Candidatus Peregrinibacteria bacterium]|nr:MAG: hypothetical protein COB57_03220 [Candidatus Peregrinibacteria bacterium]